MSCMWRLRFTNAEGLPCEREYVVDVTKERAISDAVRGLEHGWRRAEVIRRTITDEVVWSRTNAGS